jgi:hypothetical protein
MKQLPAYAFEVDLTGDRVVEIGEKATTCSRGMRQNEASRKRL